MTLPEQPGRVRPRGLGPVDGEARLASWLEDRWLRATPSRRLRSSLALAAIERESGGRSLRVLDAGCWDAALALTAARRHPGWVVVALDHDPRGLAQARATARRIGVGNVHFVQADLTQPIGSGGYDVVAAIECLTEIEDDASALDRFAEALRPGGLLVLHVPHPRWKPILRTSSPVWRLEVRHGYDPAELRSMLARSGFAIETMSPTMGDTVQLAQEIRDRFKSSRLAVRVLLLPWLVAAARLETSGITRGARRGLFVLARRR
jgi:SAM-dependent methyltransferase